MALMLATSCAGGSKLDHVVAHAPATASPAASSSIQPDDAVTLSIPDRAQDALSPKSGWCGETAIQEGLLHLGMWAPQRAIHAAGNSKHPDLYADELPVALANLGVRYAFYSARKDSFAAYESWIAEALAHDQPVVAGVKLLPTEHPDWGLDHFVLVVGQGKKGLLVNTTWGRSEWAKDTTTPGISFKDVYYGIRLLGLTLPKGAVPARLVVLDETANLVTVRLVCAGFKPGETVRIERRRHAWDPKLEWSTTVTATSSTVEQELTLEAAVPARFDCAPFRLRTMMITQR